MEKTCKGCHKTMDISNFTPSKILKDGYENKCKECRRIQRSKNHKHNCIECGTEFTNSKRSAKFCGASCQGKHRRLSKKDFIVKFLEVTGGSFDLLTEYEHSRRKIRVRHKECGFVFSATPNNLISKKSGCSKCYGNQLKSHEEFISQVRELEGDQYSILGTYQGNKEKIKIRHNTCKEEYYVAPDKFLRGRRCPSCYGNQLKTTEEYRKQVFEQVGDEYLVIGEYKNTKTKIKMKHNVCGNVYKVTPDSFLRGARCVRCQVSKGEEKIKIFLQENGFDFTEQYKIDDYRNILPLPFDFAVYGVDGLICLIEYDGELHFMAKEFFGGEEAYSQRKRNDSIKDEFCKKNGIPLIRIPYWEFENIEEILKFSLSKDL